MVNLPFSSKVNYGLLVTAHFQFNFFVNFFPLNNQEFLLTGLGSWFQNILTHVLKILITNYCKKNWVSTFWKNRMISLIYKVMLLYPWKHCAFTKFVNYVKFSLFCCQYKAFWWQFLQSKIDWIRVFFTPTYNDSEIVTEVYSMFLFIMKIVWS